MRKIFFVLALLVMLPIIAEGQVAKYKAVFTLNFIRYIGWPDEVRQGDFVIGVLREGDIAQRIEAQSSGKKFGFQDVVVKEFRTIGEITDCQVLFISSDYNFAGNADAIKQKIGDKSLIIANSEGATDHGAMINFVIRDGVLKFEIHKENAANNGLQISSRLENMSSAIVL